MNGRENNADEGGTMKEARRNKFEVPAVVDRSTFQAGLDALRVREKAHMGEDDAIAAAC